MRPGRERKELRPGNDRCEEPPFLEGDDLVVPTVKDERRGADPREDIVGIVSPVKRLLVAGRGMTVRGRPLQMIEVRD